MVRYVAILVSSMQWVEGFLKALKNFDCWCSDVFKQPITSNQRTNGPVNAHLISWPSKEQNIQNLEIYVKK